MKVVSKSAIRHIRSSLNRFLSIFGIIALGVGFFAGLQASKPDMLLSAETYFQAQNLSDFRLISTYGFDEADLEALKAADGIHVYPSYYTDCTIQTGQGDTLVRLMPLSATDQINQLVLKDGRMPENDKECLAAYESMKDGLSVGDTFTLLDNDSLGAQVAKQTYTVVGTFYSPLYIDAFSHGSTTVGDGSIDTVLYLPDIDFSGEYYTQVFLTFDCLRAYSGYSDEYTAAQEEEQTQLEEIADNRSVERFREIKDQAQKQIEEAQQQIEDGQKALDDADSALQDAKAQLADAKKALDKALAEITAGEAELAQQELLLETALADGRAKLEAAQKNYENGLAEFEAGQAVYNANLAEYNAGVAALEEAEVQLKLLAEALGTEQEAYLTAQAEYEQNVAMLSESKKALEQAAATLKTTETQLAAGKAEIDQGYSQLNEQQTTGESQLAAAKAELATGLETYNAGLTSYQANLKAYQAKLAEYQAQKPEAEAELTKARENLEDARTSLDTLEAPTWYIYNRNDNPGYSDYADNATRIGNIAKIFPAFFLLVAVLVCLTAMTRMVDEERTQIGTLKALGYSNHTILFRYLSYALSATISGSIFGLLVGFQVFPTVIVKAYSIIYQIPVLKTPFRFGIGTAALLAASLAVTLTVIITCHTECQQNPAKLMRPKSPTSGKRVLLERLPFFWNRLSFFAKVTARNIFRYKKRMYMTLIGIAGCTALTLTGFGLKDSIGVIVENQYNNVWHYQAMVAYSDATDAAYDNIVRTLQTFQPDAESITVFQKSYTASGSSGTNLDAYLVIPQDPDSLTEYISFQSRTSGETYSLSADGVLITEKLSTLLHLQVGDTITLGADGVGPITATVEGVMENYVSHYVFMEESLFQSLTGDTPDYNMAYLQYNPDTVEEADLSSALLQEDGVLQTVLLSNNRENFVNLISVLDLIVIILILSAGGLAFIVLYNLNSINITERIREISTLKVLGFQDREVTSYIFRETILLSVLGGLLGLLLGHFLTLFVVRTAEIDLVMFGRDIFLRSYLIAITITMVFSALVSLIMHHSLQKIDMVESLKSVE